MTFKNRKNKRMVTEIRIAVTVGFGTDWKEAQEIFWGARNILCQSG